VERLDEARLQHINQLLACQTGRCSFQNHLAFKE
jgi:hypothetical protein